MKKPVPRKKTLEKKKKRLQKVQQKLFAKREKHDEDMRWKRAEEIREKLEFELINGKRKPIINNLDVMADRRDAVHSQLEKNLEILKALEEEYDAEQERRKEVNESLEEEGHVTLKEKLDALHAKTLEKLKPE
jgi:hypothetical protein